MKIRFNTFDIVCAVTELQRLIGLRVNQIYDVDNKTYLIKFQQAEEKHVLLLESGIRFHSTAFDWPKNVAPSAFTMKLRKHLKNKRLEKLEQLGIDRIIDFQFGSGEAAYHVFLELYDKGNIVLTDHELTILNILRPHIESEEVKFTVREKYPLNRARSSCKMCVDEIQQVLSKAKPGESLKKALNSGLDYGPSLIEHILCKYNLTDVSIGGNVLEEESSNINDNGHQAKLTRKKKKKDTKVRLDRPFDSQSDLPTLFSAIKEADAIFQQGKTLTSKGYIIQKMEEKPTSGAAKEEYFYHNIEYHPYLFSQHKNEPFKEFNTFMAAVDEFYSTLEGQKIDMKAVQQEREALKKLSNVKKDHAKRLEELTKVQEIDKQKAELITRNQALVDRAILAIRSAIANQMSWPDIHELVRAAQLNKDPVALSINQLKLEVNHIALNLHDPYQSDDDESEINEGSSIGDRGSNCSFRDPKDQDKELSHDHDQKITSVIVDVDLALSAFANARKYYDQKRSAAKKEQRTIDASEKALKSAEKKTQQTLKEVRTISTISKARKVYWFEKFYWFISSENYLVIGGRDSQQNELIVKKYMRPTDYYVHAEIQGASSVVIKNPTGNEVPPKTLLEAGTMAISYSVAWDAKVISNAYWVKSDQVSKTAPSGEYLGTGSFMIRGKKNFLPPCHLVMGLSLLFKLEDSSVHRHKGERKIRKIEEDVANDQRIENVLKDGDVELNDSEILEYPTYGDNANTSIRSDESGDEERTFPNTHIKIDHGTGEITIQNSQDCAGQEVMPEQNKTYVPFSKDIEDEESIIPAMPTRKKQQQSSKKKKGEKEQKSQYESKPNNSENKQSAQLKRGQKGKLKKMRSKYKDQDDEEREMRMNILKSAPDKSREVTKLPEISKGQQYPKNRTEPRHQTVEREDLDDMVTPIDIDMIDSLTGCPVDEDELLFAIPVVAPYQALQNYKYKVKLSPGTGKRGKAAKIALLMFSKEKSCTLREKDLLKSVKEEALARNIPGKVKLSAPQLQKLKK